MRKKYDSHFRRLENYRQDLHSLLEGVDEQVLKQSPEEEKWSIMQIINHLILSEKSSLIYLKKKIQAENIPTQNPASSFRMLLLKLVLDSPVKFKAPKVVAGPVNGDFKESFEKWEKLRSSLEEFVNAFPEERDQQAIYKHPIAGRITLLNAFVFFEYHILHHKKQIDKILAKQAS